MAPRAHIVVSAFVLALHAVRRARVVAVLAPPARVGPALDLARLPLRRAHRDAAGPVGTLAVARCGRSVRRSDVSWQQTGRACAPAGILCLRDILEDDVLVVGAVEVVAGRDV